MSITLDSTTKLIQSLKHTSGYTIQFFETFKNGKYFFTYQIGHYELSKPFDSQVECRLTAYHTALALAA